MIINRTTDNMNFREAPAQQTDRGPKYIRRKMESGNGADIVEISDAGRRLLREKNSSPLVKAGLPVSGDIGALVRSVEQDMDLRRKQAVEELRDRIRSGAYDFDRADRLSMAAEKILAMLG